MFVAQVEGLGVAFAAPWVDDDLDAGVDEECRAVGEGEEGIGGGDGVARCEEVGGELFCFFDGQSACGYAVDLPEACAEEAGGGGVGAVGAIDAAEGDGVAGHGGDGGFEDRGGMEGVSVWCGSRGVLPGGWLWWEHVALLQEQAPWDGAEGEQVSGGRGSGSDGESVR